MIQSGEGNVHIPGHLLSTFVCVLLYCMFMLVAHSVSYQD